MKAQTDCEDTQQEQNILHVHCENCIKLSTCNVKPTVNESCEVVSCILNCGFRFHACKRSEHRLLCTNEKVACINAGNGCPVTLVRSQQARHLETCPASVIMCNMEWNRWPVIACQDLLEDQFYDLNFYDKYQGQLDVALALRDQRKLHKLVLSRIKKGKICRCTVRLHPPSECIEGRDTCANGTSFRKSICGDLLKESDATNVETQPESGAFVSVSVASCSAVTGSLAEININVDPSFELNKNIEVSDKVELSSDVCVSGVNPSSVKNMSKACGEETLTQSSNNTGNYKNICSPMDPVSSAVTPSSSNPSLFLSLDIDLTLQSFNRYQGIPHGMLTFLCAKEFRRDEYTWHYKNVHSDIHGGLNGWLEHRCPLAQYGCDYSIRRLYPSHKGSCVIYSDILESFGVKPSLELDNSVLKKTYVLVRDTIAKDDGCSMNLSRGESHCTEDEVDVSGMSEEVLEFCQLPFEVLRHLCRFLDAFSLCNMALTCLLLREVCCSFLEERGIVVQEWKKQIVDSKTRWIIAYKRWIFSTAFTPVPSWGFNERENMSNHMKSCAFFNRHTIPKPYFHLFGLTPSDDLLAKLTGGEEEEEDGKKAFSQH